MTDHRILRFFKQGVILFCQNRLETKKNVRLSPFANLCKEIKQKLFNDKIINKFDARED